ncbi:alpha/beta hydrolase [Actinomadura macrotermitis]|uniref:Uncharacterized protein n=1 Tax=Actinomadura macrotermitis TaxID=2585200 RepID=A0A7K0BY00_9ACTN|nr:alpha/beta hydrolase family protein [Actinomadura macrotermitis]MQY05514.1 hypothetical protein [Actinomadura macrotermitis]
MSRVARGRRGLRAALVTLAGIAVTAGPAVHADAAAKAPVLRKADTGAAITGRTQIDARTFDLSVKSPSIGQTVKVRVITPKGWSATSARRWPVVYTFHGGAAHYESWTKYTDIEQVAARYDAMVVMPEGGANGSYTNWYNYGRPGGPKWETFHTSEVVQLMERNFRASSARAAMGISSGGQGAITYAARHKGMFKYAASFSGIVHLTKPGIPATLMFAGLVAIPSEDPFRIWGPPSGDMANWKAHDPYLLAGNLRGTRLYLSSGLTGEPGPLDPPFQGLEYVRLRVVAGLSESTAGSTNVSLAARLKQLGIPVTTHFYQNGWHQWGYWGPEMHRAWPGIMQSIGAKRVA